MRPMMAGNLPSCRPVDGFVALSDRSAPGSRAMPDRLNREDVDVDEAWASFEREDSVALTLRVLAPDEDLMAAAPIAALIRVWLDGRSEAGHPDWGYSDFADV